MLRPSLPDSLAGRNTKATLWTLHWHIFLTDMGIAIRQEDRADQPAFGIVACLSPEQLAGTARLDGRTDIDRLGGNEGVVGTKNPCTGLIQ